MAKAADKKAQRFVHGAGRARRRLWAYGYAEIARFLDVTEVAVRAAVRAGRLDPTSLESLYEAKLRPRPLFKVKE